jgi:hypothetical protein
VPPLLATGLALQTLWFMQDRARLHIANALDFLHDTFDSRVISNRFPDCFAYGQNWPLNSPDLNPCDYFLGDSVLKKLRDVMVVILNT